MKKEKYYDGSKLLSMLDINKNKPELYICTTNRTGGKTTYFGRMLVNRFLKSGKKFALLYRFNYELDDISDKFFKDLKTLFFNEYEMHNKRKASGIFHELYITKKDDEKNYISCGYAISLNSADQLKKYSHLFSDVESILFDEFQSESKHYCNEEIRKFLSVHTSIARGQGKQVRYVPVYMLGNQVSIINPYYTQLGISERLKKDTKFLRGNGYVLENGFIESANISQKESGINKAFSKNNYVKYTLENVYLDDNNSFIEKPLSNNCRYLATLKYEDSEYSIKEYTDIGIIYCDTSIDKTFPIKISVTTKDHSINYVMLKRNDIFIQNLRFYFERGCFRFKDLKCKQAILKCISY